MIKKAYNLGTLGKAESMGLDRGTPENLKMQHSLTAVCCVIVTHNPEQKSLEKILASITRQTQHVVIVDNHSENQMVLVRWLKNRFTCQTIAMTTNVGVGAAQNKGILQAKSLGFSYILLLDQDSLPKPDMLNHLISATKKLEKQLGVPVVVGPRIVDRRIDREMPFVRFGQWFVSRPTCQPQIKNDYIQTDFLISSGMLIPLGVIEKVGLMDEGLFIDNVDLEWGFRTQKSGFRLFGVCQAVLEHRLGDKVVRLPLGKGVNIYSHPPLRQYYMMRNRIILYRRDYIPSAWVKHDRLRMLLKLMIIILFFPHRSANLFMLIKGIKDGLNGLTGRYDILNQKL